MKLFGMDQEDTNLAIGMFWMIVAFIGGLGIGLAILVLAIGSVVGLLAKIFG